MSYEPSSFIERLWLGTVVSGEAPEILGDEAAAALVTVVSGEASGVIDDEVEMSACCHSEENPALEEYKHQYKC